MTIVNSNTKDQLSRIAKKYKTPLIYSVFTFVAIYIFIINGSDNFITFGFSNNTDLIQIKPLLINSLLVNKINIFIFILLSMASYFIAKKLYEPPKYISFIFVATFIIGFLVWSVSKAETNEISLANLLAGSVMLSIPLVFGSLSGVLCERVGVINIAIEGQLLGGAFTASLISTLTNNPHFAIITSAFAGALIASILALFSIKYKVNQIIVGIVINVLISGLTGFFYSTVMTKNPSSFNSPARLSNINIPLLSEMPILGPILFRQTIIGYLMYVTVILIYIVLFKTKWGLQMRAVGEHPKAADAVGINVNKTRFKNVLFGGAIAGVGGSFFTLVSVDSFTKDMTAGKGFIALAALIFGCWNPVGAFFAALLFGFADNLQSVMTIIGTPIPSSFMAMLPYLATILAVSGFVGGSRGPASAGIPYEKG